MSLTSDLRTVDYDVAAAAAALPAATRLGPVHLTVTDLARSVPFYEDVVGLTVQWRGTTDTDEPAVALGSDGTEPVVVLVENPTASPQRRTSGLYHVALRYPTRESLGHLIRRIAETRTPIQGASDHGTHEAIYLPDPDGNGLELEWDRPRADWPPMAEEFSRGGPQPLDVESTVATTGSAATEARSAGVDMGHLHLHVGAIRLAEDFYRDVLGFSLIAALPSAIFMSAGGYHHHLGANIWNGPGAPPAAPGSVGLRRWSVVVPEADDLGALMERIERGVGVSHVTDEDGALVIADPSGNAVVVETAAQRGAAPIGHQRPTPPR
ncbi:MAG: VOC family protein [Solirubrobacteraceae bacterium]|nr:VOC family protein [Solirubrobacteraceae bacterium]